MQFQFPLENLTRGLLYSQEFIKYIFTVSWTCLRLSKNMLSIASIKGVTVSIDRVESPNKCPKAKQEYEVKHQDVVVFVITFNPFNFISNTFSIVSDLAFPETTLQSDWLTLSVACTLMYPLSPLSTPFMLLVSLCCSLYPLCQPYTSPYAHFMVLVAPLCSVCPPLCPLHCLLFTLHHIVSLAPLASSCKQLPICVPLYPLYSLSVLLQPLPLHHPSFYLLCTPCTPPCTPLFSWCKFIPFEYFSEKRPPQRINILLNEGTMISSF